MRTFTVSRATWRRGGNTDELERDEGKTELLNDMGYRCCLGFVAAQCGVPDEELLEVAYPNSIDWRPEIEPILIDGPNLSILARDAVGINDRPDVADDTREQWLVELFAKHGYQLVFTD